MERELVGKSIVELFFYYSYRIEDLTKIILFYGRKYIPVSCNIEQNYKEKSIYCTLKTTVFL